MISPKWQRRSPKNIEIESGPSVLSRLGGRLSAVASGLMYQSIEPSLEALPEERHDNGPFGRLGPNSAQTVRRGASAVGRTISAPFGALLTVTVADGFVRVLTARGNRVRAWAESDLPPGVVQHGLIVDEQTFIEVLSGVIKEIARNGKLNSQKVAVAITGRNMVQRRLTVYVEDGQELVDAIVDASSDSMSIRTEEMQIEWDAEELDLIEEDEFDELEDEDEDEELDSEEPVVTADTVVSEQPVAQVPEELGLENLSVSMEQEPDGDPYDVYALALHKHVIRRNLRTVSELSTGFAGVQPKILALAAAVNSRAAVILDIEENTLLTAVVSNGLPEVIREVGIDKRMSEQEWETLVSKQISQAVSFYDSIFPEEPLGADVEVFLTGDADQAKLAVDKVLENLPYALSSMPRTLRAPDDFPFEKYAANVGMVLVSGKRFWQRAPVHLLSTPKFDFRPKQYRPRPLPVGAVLKFAAVLILGFGVLSSYQAYTSQVSSVDSAKRTLDILQLQSDLRAVELVETRDARLQLEAAKAKTERLIAANEVLEDQDNGFGDTVSIISKAAPSDVKVTLVDDDGRIVAVSAASGDYPEMLAFIRLLEDVPQFQHVQVLSMGRDAAVSSGDGSEPAAQGGSVVLESEVEASLVITRIKIDDNQILVGEELVAVND
ncbi:hypothetical protein [Candidatus Lucifugimonas marina]|uniref:PilN domain-containing protein n=1 Tax=Candidatus Lucifugimonas marina TaxID=3038979 RepID=A0AAJ5ZHI9_9CHLR|nr:hypothetical protein [SAR202 cluster bacterium JH702]MDG0868301.1 hypothetical protein [SAR202 cluster bacterium JH639]WFG34945.1 hypothetical protein GKN94_04325 [SAR202 cluster bacterium JH545]WFG38896.1 hypothetical protein GKO48_04460 [SAR202 cluster bacterium JH1073]